MTYIDRYIIGRLIIIRNINCKIYYKYNCLKFDLGTEDWTAGRIILVRSITLVLGENFICKFDDYKRLVLFS